MNLKKKKEKKKKEGLKNSKNPSSRQKMHSMSWRKCFEEHNIVWAWNKKNLMESTIQVLREMNYLKENNSCIYLDEVIRNDMTQAHD